MIKKIESLMIQMQFQGRLLYPKLHGEGIGVRRFNYFHCHLVIFKHGLLVFTTEISINLLCCDGEILIFLLQFLQFQCNTNAWNPSRKEDVVCWWFAKSRPIYVLGLPSSQSHPWTCQIHGFERFKKNFYSQGHLFLICARSIISHVSLFL